MCSNVVSPIIDFVKFYARMSCELPGGGVNRKKRKLVVSENEFVSYHTMHALPEFSGPAPN